ncbi:MAG: cysteine hydrolase [Candidatus Heimdallarchaeota archaeon]|nr:cysteine hydrolase [Candidatus Heimdallarchaeota archaeon]MCK4955658.1 cysteine hydrolase [Candidatus Heimdallarchaeota archaeon]
MTHEIIFWDVDTQKDFIDPDGKLYVYGAENIKENLAKLTQFARIQVIRILGSVDYHTMEDSEITTDEADFENTFPPHCLVNEPGQEKIIETRSDMALWIDPKKYSGKEIDEIIASKGPIFFRKIKFDVFSNPNVNTILEKVNPKKIVIYGVAADFCVRLTIDEFLDMNKYELYLVIDAIEGLDELHTSKLIEEWISKGVKTLTTESVLQGVMFS